MGERVRQGTGGPAEERQVAPPDEHCSKLEALGCRFVPVPLNRPRCRIPYRLGGSSSVTSIGSSWGNPNIRTTPMPVLPTRSGP